MKIAVIEYGVGNIQSVVNTLQRMEIDPAVVSDGKSLIDTNPDYVVLPGVGAMGHALQMLRQRGLEDALNTVVREQGKPFLGICVGMQIMAETCEEFGLHSGFGWIPGKVRHLTELGVDLCLPHVGWNTVEATTQSHPMTEAISGHDAYFLHSCSFDCAPEFALATTEYGCSFVSVVGDRNIVGVQFHPEKSAFIGETLFAAFLQQ